MVCEKFESISVTISWCYFDTVPDHKIVNLSKLKPRYKLDGVRKIETVSKM